MPGLSLRQKSKLKTTVQGKFDHPSTQPPLKAKSTLFILWKDAHANGVKGIVELHVSDLLLTLKSARVKDLFPVLNKKINDQYQVDSYRREVERFLLCGTRVSRDRRLDPLIPDLSLTPRFVAVMRAFPKRMPRTNIFVSIKTLTKTNLVLHCESSDTVGNMKAKIEKEVKISQQSQKLIYAGKQLEDHLALSTYGIVDMSQIHLVRMMNGGGTSRVFADISDNSLLKERQLYFGGAERLAVLKGRNIADAQTHGLKGVVALSELDLPFKTARVGDLFSLLNVKINSKYQGDRKFREVESIQLYGSHLRPDRLLDPLIPELGLVPRFVAVTRVYKKVPRTNISVFVKTLTNNNILIHCSSYAIVGSLKGKIQDKLNITRAAQCLVYANMQLEDHLSLLHYGITNRSQTYLVRMMNGGGASRVFADLSGNSLRVEDFAREAPAYRMAYQGLNIEGKCENPQCTAFLKWIICPKRFQEFNIVRDEDITCPMCHSKVIPLTCGFYDCTWKFDGIQSNSGNFGNFGNSVISQWKDARGHKYHRFYPDKSVGWESLLIIAKQLGVPSVKSAEPC